MKYIVILIASLSFCGCKTAKDNAAVGRVLGSTDLSNRVYSSLEAEHPCVNTDSIYVIKGDTTVTIDTLPLIYSNANNNAGVTNSTSTVYVHDSIPYGIQTMIVIKRIKSVDTLTNYVTDEKRVNELTAQVNVSNGQNAQLNTDLSAANKKGDFWFYMFIALCGLLSIGLVIKLISKTTLI